jgi:hypothetical protein
VKIVLALLVVAALGAGGFALFERFEQGEVKKQADRACGTLDTPSGSPVLPSGLTLPSDQKLLRVDTQGKTTVVYASTAGVIEDVEQVRDRVLDALVTQGYTKGSTEAEKNIEAEGEFGGKGGGTIKVKPLCTDRLEVRYKLNG